jgi:hypothetical protein
MNRYVNIGVSCATAAIFAAAAAAVSAQAQPPTTAKPAQPPTTTTKPADPPAPTAKPATAKPATAKPAQQQTMQSEGTGSTTNLGSVRIPRDVKADGQALAAGTYQIRVTETPATPPAPGQTPQYERWAEFLRGGKVVGREVVTVVPAADIKQVAEVTPPAPGGARTEVLKGGDYLRLWLNRGGNHYLIHFNI